MSALPFGSSVAVAKYRGVSFLVSTEGAGVACGSYNSVLVRRGISAPPISALPLGSSVAVAQKRPAFMTGVEPRLKGVGHWVVQLRTRETMSH